MFDVKYVVYIYIMVRLGTYYIIYIYINRKDWHHSIDFWRMINLRKLIVFELRRFIENLIIFGEYYNITIYKFVLG